MKHSQEREPPQYGAARPRPSPRLLTLVIAFSLVVSLAAAVYFDDAFRHQSLFALSNLVGPATRSLLNGGGLTVCTTAMGTPGNPICFHAGRMPVPSLVVALGLRLFGDRFLPVALFKTLLFLLPVEYSVLLVWRRLPNSVPRRCGIVLLLLAPFFMTSFLANVVNLQVEEAYAYSVLSVAVALLLFEPTATQADALPRLAGLTHVLFFGLAIDVLYLAKSSMAPAAAVLTLAFLLRQKSALSRLLLLVVIMAAPLGWALHQHHASGRYTLGTSLDGINLHKGNVATFLSRYPPPAGSSLDQYDSDLNRGLSFRDEWSFNDFHQQAALTFMRSHPRDTLLGDLRKLNILLLSVTKYGSSVSHGWQLHLETAGLLLFRIILWASILGSLFTFFTTSARPLRAAAVTWLALLAACVLPYLAGFAYTRHASILIYPACLMCCRLLCGAGDSVAVISPEPSS